MERRSDDDGCPFVLKTNVNAVAGELGVMQEAAKVHENSSHVQTGQLYREGLRLPFAERTHGSHIESSGENFSKLSTFKNTFV